MHPETWLIFDPEPTAAPVPGTVEWQLIAGDNAVSVGMVTKKITKKL